MKIQSSHLHSLLQKSARESRSNGVVPDIEKVNVGSSSVFDQRIGTEGGLSSALPTLNEISREIGQASPFSHATESFESSLSNNAEKVLARSTYDQGSDLKKWQVSLPSPIYSTNASAAEIADELSSYVLFELAAS